MNETTDRVISIDGLRLAIDAQDSLGLTGPQAFEPEVLAALRRWVQPGQTVIDIGANIGYFTAHLARGVGDAGVVHAFEPEPGNHRLLARNMRDNGLRQVQLHAAALGEAPGRATLHTTAYNGGMHRLYESVCCEGPTVDVPVQRLDDLFAPGSVALIKIDVEGYEHAVLRGAWRLLSSTPRPRIVSEYCPLSLMEAGSTPAAFVRDLLSWGLLPFDLSGQPIPPAALLADAALYEGYGRDRFYAQCHGRSNPEIAAIMVDQTRALGCQRPIIENLLFADRV